MCEGIFLLLKYLCWLKRVISDNTASVYLLNHQLRSYLSQPSFKQKVATLMNPHVLLVFVTKKQLIQDVILYEQKINI